MKHPPHMSIHAEVADADMPKLTHFEVDVMVTATIPRPQGPDATLRAAVEDAARAAASYVYDRPMRVRASTPTGPVSMETKTGTRAFTYVVTCETPRVSVATMDLSKIGIGTMDAEQVVLAMDAKTRVPGKVAAHVDNLTGATFRTHPGAPSALTYDPSGVRLPQSPTNPTLYDQPRRRRRTTIERAMDTLAATIRKATR